MARSLKNLNGSGQEILIPVNIVSLKGNLILPAEARSLVLFVHGSGSSRFSPRNQCVANTLSEAGFGTLLFDLLTEAEEAIDLKTASLRFNIELLSARVIAVTDWLACNPATAGLSLGYFGASTGAAAALQAACKRPERVKAVVSRGGRPDLAGNCLLKVQAPTLLIVGGKDQVVKELNQEALSLLPCRKSLITIPGAGHLFEEPGALERVSLVANNWFKEYLLS